MRYERLRVGSSSLVSLSTSSSASMKMGSDGAGIEEISYKDLGKQGLVAHQLAGGWLAMNDKYWLVALAPAEQQRLSMLLAALADQKAP